jgi:hypothetical protein
MARIKITNAKTGEVREVEELVLTSHLHRKGWTKIEKFEPVANLEKFPADDEQVENEVVEPNQGLKTVSMTLDENLKEVIAKPETVKTKITKQEIGKASWADLTAITQPKEHKTRGRKPKDKA